MRSDKSSVQGLEGLGIPGVEGLAKLSKNGVGFGRRVLAVGSPFQVTREIYTEVLFRFDLFKFQLISW